MNQPAGRPDLELEYRRLQPALLRLLRHAHAQLGEDIAADVWVEVAGALPRFVGDETDFRAWVFCLARRRLIDSYRRAGRRPVDSLSGVEHVDQAADGPEEDVLSLLWAESTIAILHEILSPEQVEVVLLRVVGGFKAERVARVMGKEPVNVRVIQYRALRRLAEELGPEPHIA